MAATLKLVQGDTRPQLVFALADEVSGVPLDLSASEAIFRMRERGASTVKAELGCGRLPGRVLEDGSIDLAPPFNTPGRGGRLYLAWDGTALNTAGDYEAELELTFPDGTVQTPFDVIRLQVREQF